jgi:hypothetical protein
MPSKVPQATVIDSDPAGQLGAPVAKDAIDPELVRLSRPPLRIGLLSSFAIVAACLMFIVRLNADRQFAGTSTEAKPVVIADVLAGRVAVNQHVVVSGRPVVSSAIRVTKSVGAPGLKVAPLQGSADRIWIAVAGELMAPVQPGPNMDRPSEGTSERWGAGTSYRGRLRRLQDVRFSDVMRGFTNRQPRPAFTTVAAFRAGLTAGSFTSVMGDSVAVADGDRVIAEVIDPNAATVRVTFIERLPGSSEWKAALVSAGVIAAAAEPTASDADSLVYAVREPDAVAAVTRKLEAAKLYASTVDPVTRKMESTVAALRASPAQTLPFGVDQIADKDIDLLGIYAVRSIPADSYVLLVGERPADYWYVLPVTIALALLAMLFAWSFVRTLQRDVLRPRAA